MKKYVLLAMSMILLLGGTESMDDVLDLGELTSVKKEAGNSYEGLFD